MDTMPSSQVYENKKSSKHIILSILLVIMLLVAGGGVYLYYSTNNKLEDTQARLTDANESIQKLEASLKSARDTQRKKDIALFAGVVEDYKQTKGSYPTTESTESKKIYNSQLSKSVANFSDPTTGSTYGFVAVPTVHTPPSLELGVIQYQWPGKCGANDFEDTNDQSFAAVRTVLEDGTTYCLDV